MTSRNRNAETRNSSRVRLALTSFAVAIVGALGQWFASGRPICCHVRIAISAQAAPQLADEGVVAAVDSNPLRTLHTGALTADCPVKVHGADYSVQRGGVC